MAIKIPKQTIRSIRRKLAVMADSRGMTKSLRMAIVHPIKPTLIQQMVGRDTRIWVRTGRGSPMTEYMVQDAARTKERTTFWIKNNTPRKVDTISSRPLEGRDLMASAC